MFVGPAFQHYRCYIFYVPSTRATRISDSIAWFPLPMYMQSPSLYALAQFAVEDLSTALKLLSTGSTLDISNALSLTQQMSSLLDTAALDLAPTSNPNRSPTHLFPNPFITDVGQSLQPFVDPLVTLPVSFPSVDLPAVSTSLPTVDMSTPPASLPRVHLPLVPVKI